MTFDLLQEENCKMIDSTVQTLTPMVIASKCEQDALNGYVLQIHTGKPK